MDRVLCTLSAGTVIRRQNLTSKDGLRTERTHTIGIQMKQKKNSDIYADFKLKKNPSSVVRVIGKWGDSRAGGRRDVIPSST